MKIHLLLVLIISLFATNLDAQWIDSIYISPANPKSTDTIYVYADCIFPYGSCDEKTQTINLNQANVYTQATHCLGMLTVICYETDTFKMDPLPAGNYNFIFNLNSGTYPVPCTPGIIPGPIDTLSFTVLDATAIPAIEKNFLQFKLFPKPAKDNICIEAINDSPASVLVSLFSQEGKEIYHIPYQFNSANPLLKIDTSHLPAGIYLVKIITDKGFVFSDKIILSK